MKWIRLFALLIILLVDEIYSLSPTVHGKDGHFVVQREDKIEEGKVIRVKRAPLIKLPLLAGAAIIGKKALLLGGAAVGAKALVGAGVLGAGLYKAKYYNGGYGGGYGGGYASYQHTPYAYVGSSWG